MVLSIYGLCLTCFNLSWHDSPNGLILFEMPWNHHQHLWRPWSKPKFQLRSTHSHHIHCFVGVICISAASTPSFGWFVPILHSETTIFPLKMAMGKKLHKYIPYSSSTNFGYQFWMNNSLKKQRLSIFWDQSSTLPGVPKNQDRRRSSGGASNSASRLSRMSSRRFKPQGREPWEEDLLGFYHVVSCINILSYSIMFYHIPNERFENGEPRS